MASTSSLLSSEVRLKRFLHYGSELPLCLPGDRFFMQSFTLDKLTAIESMLADCAPDKQGDAVNHIMKAFMDGYSGYPECLIFALAVCASQKSSEALRRQAYNVVKTVCKTPKDLFLFVSFMKNLSTPTKGCGSGWRKAVSEWYLSKEPLELATHVSHVRGDYGFTHRDLFKLAHPKTDDLVKKVIICYVMKGLEAAKIESDKENPNIQKVISYLQTIEEVKHQNDAQSCARLLESHKLPIAVTPHNLHKSAEVWIAVVPLMPLRALLDNLISISCNGLLRAGQLLESVIEERLSNQTAIVESHLHPTEVFSVMMRFENHAKNTYELMEKLIKQGKLVKHLKPAPKPNAKVLAALNKLMRETFKLLVPTGMRYLVALDLSSNMKNWKCNGNRDVKPAHAATLLALCLLHAERDVTVAAFPPLLGAPPEEELIDPTNPVTIPQATSRRGKQKKTGEGVIYPRKTTLQPMLPLSLNKEMSIIENLDIMSQTVSGPVEVCQPVVWAQENKKAVDVFIVLTDYVTKRKREFMEPAAALQDYREKMNLPNSKFITCAFAANTLDVAASNDAGMLDIVGFDGKLARIIEAFSRGAF